MTVSEMTGSTVFVLAARGVRRALLISRTVDRRDRPRCKVRVLGSAAAVRLDPSLVFDRPDTAHAAWLRARQHQADVVRAGARLRVVDAHLSLAYAEAGHGAQLVA